ncbi:MAG: alpha/beta fold hydrolase BchO [Pseudomonadota bacterium]
MSATAIPVGTRVAATSADSDSFWQGPVTRHRRARPTVDWSYAVAGDGPAIVLLHGTGSAIHTWRGLGPLLAERFQVVAIDLPGHGDSDVRRPDVLTLNGMAAALADLLVDMAIEPQLIIGHSAGAAVAAQLAIGYGVTPQKLVALNGAFLRYGGPAQSLFAPLAGVLAGSRWVTELVASRADDIDQVDRMIRSTGSKLDATGLRAYQQTLSSPQRISATLTMMAKWRVEPLFNALSQLTTPLHLIVGRRDAAVTPWQSDRVIRACPAAYKSEIDAVGHLMHEEQPAMVAAVILADIDRDGANAQQVSAPKPANYNKRSEK